MEQTMNEERARILKLLEDGKITAQDAERLLLAVKGQTSLGPDGIRVKMFRHRHPWPDIAHIVENATRSARRGQGDELRQRFEVTSGSRLKVRNISGDVSISSWPEPRIEVAAEEGGLSRARAVENEVVAKALSGELTVSAPSDIELEVGTVSGNIEVQGQFNRVRLRTVSGDITAQDIRQEIEIASASGDISLQEVQGRCQITSVSGDVVIGVNGDLSGSLESKSGDIQVSVPAQANLLIEAEITGRGEIVNHTRTAVELTPTDEHHLSLRFSNGGHRLRIVSRDGDIEIIEGASGFSAARTDN
ncbi:MAG: DUF4097 family beta strand repeat-containing protein, partial [candidate division WOR-3 bacterium]